MMIIPFKDPGSWVEQIQLTGIFYNLHFYWNALNEYWVMDIFDTNGNVIIYGIKVVVNWNLTGQFIISGMPKGDITCQNVLGNFDTIQRFDMGVVDETFYYEPEELASMINVTVY